MDGRGENANVLLSSQFDTSRVEMDTLMPPASVAGGTCDLSVTRSVTPPSVVYTRSQGSQNIIIPFLAAQLRSDEKRGATLSGSGTGSNDDKNKSTFSGMLYLSVAKILENEFIYSYNPKELKWTEESAT